MSLATDLTYLQLRQRIVGNLNRDDLDASPLADSVVHQFVLRAVNYYAKEYFYNARTTDTSKSTVVGEAFVDLPDGWQSVNFLRFDNGGLWIPIGTGRPIPYAKILQKDVTIPSTQGVPAEYAIYPNPTGGKMAVRIFPVPGAVYDLEFTMDGVPDAPTADGDSNFWTQDAQSLIINYVCEMICREKINRPMKAGEHQRLRETEELSLNSKSIRIGGGLQAKAWF